MIAMKKWKEITLPDARLIKTEEKNPLLCCRRGLKCKNTNQT